MKRVIIIFSSTLLLSILTAFTPNNLQESSNVDPSIYKLMEMGYMWNFLSQSYELIRERDDTWLEVGLRSKYATAKKYASLEIIETTFGMSVFIRGPHKGEMNFNSKTSFGYYNPEFISKLKSNIEIALKYPMFKQVIKSTYEQHFKSMALTYQEAYRFLNDDPQQLAALQNQYLSVLAQPEGTTDGSLQEVFRGYADNGYFSDENEVQAYQMRNPDANWYEEVTAPAFWLRRSIDGTSKDISDLLNMIIKEME